MKLLQIYETYKFINDEHYYAYHVTNSFHIVKNIFKKGFRTPSGIDRVCFSDVPWDDFGLYVIKVIAKKDEHFTYGAPEGGSYPHNIKPIKWGFIFNADDIYWVDESPAEVDLKKYDKLIKSRVKEEWKIKNWTEDLKAKNSNDRILQAHLGRGYSYDITDIDKQIAAEILKLLKSNSLVNAFKKSKMQIPAFKDYVMWLSDHGLYNWSMSPDD